MRSKSFSTALLATILAFFGVAQADGALIVHHTEASFDSTVTDPITEDFTSGPGDLQFFSSNPCFEPVLVGGKVVVPTDGNLFQATAIAGPDTFTSFGITVWGAGPGVFALFVDGELEWVRPANQQDFFIGVTGEFDLVAFSANIGPYMLDNAKFTLIPNPATFTLLSVGLFFVLPQLVRGRWTQRKP